MTTPLTISPLHKRSKQEDVIGRLLVTLLYSMSGGTKIVLDHMFTVWICLSSPFYCIVFCDFQE